MRFLCSAALLARAAELLRVEVQGESEGAVQPARLLTALPGMLRGDAFQVAAPRALRARPRLTLQERARPVTLQEHAPNPPRPVTLEESEPPAANVPQEPTRLLDFAEAFYKATDALGVLEEASEALGSLGVENAVPVATLMAREHAQAQAAPPSVGEALRRIGGGRHAVEDIVQGLEAARSGPELAVRAPRADVEVAVAELATLRATLEDLDAQLRALGEGPPLSALEAPLLVCTTAGSLEGMAFCRHAIEGGYRVRACIRNPESPRAQRLAELGAELCVADNLDEASLRRAFRGAHGIYAVTTWSGSTFARDGTVQRAGDLSSAALLASEVTQGENIIRAAEQTPGLQHFILQSMHRGGQEVKYKAAAAPLHHRAKWQQEAALRGSSLERWSVLRQPTYLENFGNDEGAAAGTQLRLLRPGVVSGLLAPDTELTVIAVDDLGALAVAMFNQSDAYAGRVLAAGADRVCGNTLAAAASRVNGRQTFAYKPVPPLVLEYLIPVEYPKQLRKWLEYGGNDEGAHGGAEQMIRECRKLYPQLTSVDDWMRERGVQHFEPPVEQKLQRSLKALGLKLQRRAPVRR